ncbi:MAG: hypothetical protein IJU45_01155 [Clostridia bacterium]|nr:hypothetical protein [Clostridia bacterium]
MTETKIYIGLNDSQTLDQKFDTDKYKKILKQVCFNYHIPFSVSVSEGGYFHENGDYTEENTLVITLIDVPDITVNEIAKDLCAFFNQESVMITTDTIRAYFITEKI